MERCVYPQRTPEGDQREAVTRVLCERHSFKTKGGPMKRLLICLATCLAMIFAATTPASASTSESHAAVEGKATGLARAAWARGASDVTKAIPDYDAFVAELEASPFPRESFTEDGQEVTVYTLPGLTYTIAEPMMSPMVSGGSNQYGIWVKFNNTEQKMIANGGGAALGVAICAIPGVGWVV